MPGPLSPAVLIAALMAVLQWEPTPGLAYARAAAAEKPSLQVRNRNDPNASLIDSTCQKAKRAMQRNWELSVLATGLLAYHAYSCLTFMPNENLESGTLPGKGNRLSCFFTLRNVRQSIGNWYNNIVQSQSNYTPWVVSAPITVAALPSVAPPQSTNIFDISWDSLKLMLVVPLILIWVIICMVIYGIYRFVSGSTRRSSRHAAPI